MGNDLHCMRPKKHGASGGLEPHCFKVRNVNESGHVVNKGYLEVTPTDLVLHVVNAEPVRWPLRCLRRYGHDANLFSFESGRRCATGPGIYAFKSKNAVQIFRLVQQNAQHPDETLPSPTGDPSTMPGNPLSGASLRQRSLNSNDTASPQAQTISPASSNASGVNGIGHAAMNGSLSSHPSVGSSMSPTSPSPVYFNGNGSIGNGSLRTSPISPTIQYVNSMAFEEIPESPLETTPDDSIPNNVLREEESAHDASVDSFGDPALNYARLKLPVDEDKKNVDGSFKDSDDRSTIPEERDGHGKEKEESRTAGEDAVGERAIGTDEKEEEGVDLLDGWDGSDDKIGSIGSDPEIGIKENEMEKKQEKSMKCSEKEEEVKDSPLDMVLSLKDSEEFSRSKESDNVVTETADTGDLLMCVEEKHDCGVRSKVKKNGKYDVSDVERTALLQDVANGNIRPEKFKDRILVNYANLTEQQIQEVLQKLETSRYDNISPCTVCSNSSSNASQRVSPLSYYANLDTAGELPPNWQPNGFQFYPELRTPRSTSSKGSTGSEFTFDVNRGSCSPVDHNYANLDTLPEVQPLRHSLSSGGAPNGASNWMILQPPPKGKVNYIQLEFDENDQPIIHNVRALRRSMSSSASTTPPKTPISPPTEIAPPLPGAKTDIYARIDIEKTVALAKTHSQVEGDAEISTRRTRHDVWTENKTR